MEKPKPVWQANDCPSWCTTTHSDMDGVDSRECVSDQRVIGLTTEETLIVSPYPNVRAVLDEVHVALEQGYREETPRITVYRADGHGFGLTLGEAADLMDDIRALLVEAGK
jgi:hypothetical protein